jgi:hypothetical protein
MSTERAEVRIENEATLRHVLDGITFAPSCLDMGWAWQIEAIPGRGWFVNTTFRRPDSYTGEIGTGSGRKEFVAIGATESSVVKTAWLLAELIVRHELMEAFLYRGVRIFDPHRTVDELALPAIVAAQKSAESRVARGLHPEPGPHCVHCGARLTPAEISSQLPDHDEVCDACLNT